MVRCAAVFALRRHAPGFGGIFVSQLLKHRYAVILPQ
jgi:hypothetical protein